MSRAAMNHGVKLFAVGLGLNAGEHERRLDVPVERGVHRIPPLVAHRRVMQRRGRRSNANIERRIGGRSHRRNSKKIGLSKPEGLRKTQDATPPLGARDSA
jgi:hypothetical protein